MGKWKTQLLAHRDEATEKTGLAENALPNLSVIQAAGLLGWYRQERGVLLNKTWWRAAMILLTLRAEKVGWEGKAGDIANSKTWDALRKVTTELDRLAPSGRVSVSDGLRKSAARRIPGMLMELKSKKGMPLSPPPLPSYARTPKPDTKTKTTKLTATTDSPDTKKGSVGILLIIIILAALAA